MEPEEKELIKGLVYVTDFRKPNKTQQQQIEHFETEFYESFSTPNAEQITLQEVDQLLAELKELQIKLFHLERSNREIQELDPTWQQDAILRDAVMENTSILHRYKKRIEYLKQSLHAKHALPANYESQLQSLQQQILEKQEQIHQQEEQREKEEEEMKDENLQPSSGPAFAQDMEEEDSSHGVYL